MIRAVQFLRFKIYDSGLRFKIPFIQRGAQLPTPATEIRQFGSTLSPQRVLDAIPASADQALDFAHIAQAAGVASSVESLLRDYLVEFVRVRLVHSKGNRFWRARSHALVIGVMSGTRSGHAFVIPDDPAKRLQGDLYISRRRMGAALHGDRVIARIV